MKLGDQKILVYLIWIIPLLVFFLLWSIRKTSRLSEKFAEKGLLEEIMPANAIKYKKLSALFLISAVSLIIFAIARPQWGYMWKTDKFEGLDMIIALDASKSMLATDSPPSRITFAKNEIREFAKELEGDRLGLIAFSGEAFLQCPLTSDKKGFLLTLKNLDVGTIPVGGTSIPAAIDEAIRSYSGGVTTHRILVIITDGENTTGDIEKAIARAKQEKITISCIGIGSAKGEPIPVADDNGNITYLKDRSGNIVRSKLMEDTLKKVSADTGGKYVRAKRIDFGIRKIYDNEVSKYSEKGKDERRVKVHKERFQYPLGLAVVFLLAHTFIGAGYAKKRD